MNHPVVMLLLRWAVLALGVTLATKLVPGIHCDEPTTLLVVVLLLSFFNAVLRPLLVLFTLPFILVTMGFGSVLINAFLFLLVGKLVDGCVVMSFWAALFGAIIVGVTNIAMSSFLRPKQPQGSQGGGQGPRPPRGPDVIDV
jgi:putative membrane protein